MKTPQEELLEVQSYILNQLDDICDDVRMSIPCKRVKDNRFTSICISYVGAECKIFSYIYYSDASTIEMSCAYLADGGDGAENILDNVTCGSISEAVDILKKVFAGFRLVTT